VNGFVEECRSEWRRLGVPDPVADEMAADLAADLEEAEAEGASPEDVLGSGARDPRAFAAAWASERGLIQSQPPRGRRRARRYGMPAAVGALALIAIVGAVLLIVDARSSPRRLTLASPLRPPLGAVWVTRDLARPPAEALTVTAAEPRRVRIIATPAAALSPDGRMLAFLTSVVDGRASAPGLRIVSAETNHWGRTVGFILLTLGLTGIVFSSVSWWVGPGGRSGRRMGIDARA
jgi:hypothetical protein